MQKTLSKLTAVLLICGGLAMATENTVTVDVAYQYCLNPDGNNATLYEKWTNSVCSGPKAYFNQLTKRTSKQTTGVTCIVGPTLTQIQMDNVTTACECMQKWGPNIQITVSNPACLTDSSTHPWNKLYDDCGGL